MKKLLCGIGLFLVCIGVNCSVMATSLPFYTPDVLLRASDRQATSSTRTAHNFKGWCLNESGSAGNVNLQLRQGNLSSSNVLQTVTIGRGDVGITEVWGRDDCLITCFIRIAPASIPLFGNPGCSAIGTMYYDGL